MSSVEVYWFDDTGIGQCRIPGAWRLFYKHHDQWLPAAGASEYGLAPDKFNRLSFDPVKTDGLHLEVDLQSGYSGGILEWQVAR